MENLSEEKKNAGNDQCKLENYEAALKLYSEAIVLSPNNAKYYDNRSACHMMMRNYKEALDDSQRAVSIDDQFFKGYERLIKCCLALGDVVGAKKAIKKIAEVESLKTEYKKLKTEYKQLRHLKVAIDKCYKEHNYKRAYDSVCLALEIATACSTTNLLKAELLICLGRLQEAYRILENYLETEPLNPYTIFLYGLYLYYKDDQLNKCFMQMIRVLELDPDHEKAKSVCRAALQLKDLRDSGNRLFSEGKFQSAYDSYTEALKIIPLSEDMKSKLLFNRALMCSKMVRINEAIENCNSSLEINRTYFKATVLRAQCYEQLRRYTLSIEGYKAALKIEYNSDIAAKLERLSRHQETKKKRLGRGLIKGNQYHVLEL